MANFFGRRAAPPKPTVTPARVEEVLGQLQTQIDRNEKRQMVLEKEVLKYKKAAQAFYRKKNIPKAKHALSIAKGKEKQVRTLLGMTVKLSSVRTTLEQKESIAQNVGAFKMGVDLLKDASTSLTLEDFEEVMEDFDEQVGMVDEMAEALGATEDDAELDEELEELMGVDLDAEVEGMDAVEEGEGEGVAEGDEEMPSVPTDVPSIEEPDGPRRTAAAAGGGGGGGDDGGVADLIADFG